MKLTPIVGAAAVALACSGLALAQDPAPTNRNATRGGTAGTSMNSAMTPTMAKDYVNQAAMSDMFEVQAGKVATQKSKDTEVKNFAEQMVKDHTQTTDMLKQALSQDNKDITPPTDLDGAHKQMLTRLEDASDADFNKAYMDMQVQGHQQALKLHETYASRGDDPKLKSFAKEVVPKIKEHLAMAQRIDRGLATTASYKSSRAPGSKH
jgi:putative membrane protein